METTSSMIRQGPFRIQVWGEEYRVQGLGFRVWGSEWIGV